ncbi:MAG: histidine kinase [Acidobacteriia bacterium]|nr:histidine kinase [Terriglobia bacterium]
MSRRVRFALLIFLLATAFGTLEFFYRYLDTLAHDVHESPLIKFIEEFSGAYSAFLFAPAVIWITRRYPPSWRNVPQHLALLIPAAICSTSLMWGIRVVLFPLFGLGEYDYGRMPQRYFMEFPAQTLGYLIAASLTVLYDRQVRAVQLERSLAQAQLANLRLQMQPHFLFNTLNTISAVMYEDVRVADKMLARLSDLLRMSLEQTGAQEVTLDREIEFLRLYVETMKARFEERLDVSIDAPKETLGAMVPPLLLQPLVENSIRHGGPKVNVHVSARRENGTLLLEVRDHGPGISGNRKGIGLSNTAERLERLYGGSDRLDLRNDNGLVVTLKVPFHVDPNAAGG